MPDNPPSQTSGPGRGEHPRDGQSVRNVLVIAAAATALVIASLIVPAILMAVFPKHRPMQNVRPLGLLTAPDLKPLQRFDEPNVSVDDDRSQRLALQSEQTARLNSYGWVDRSNGIVRIPIERAMDLSQQRFSAAPSSKNNSSPELMKNRPEQQ